MRVWASSWRKFSESSRTGDYAAAKALFDTYGIQFDPKLRDEVIERVKKLDLPSYSAFVMPRLASSRAADGTPTDVTISYPMDLTQQMLEFSVRGFAK